MAGAIQRPCASDCVGALELDVEFLLSLDAAAVTAVDVGIGECQGQCLGVVAYGAVAEHVGHVVVGDLYACNLNIIVHGVLNGYPFVLDDIAVGILYLAIDILSACGFVYPEAIVEGEAGRCFEGAAGIRAALHPYDSILATDGCLLSIDGILRRTLSRHLSSVADEEFRQMSIDAVFSVDIERARTLDVAIFGGNAVCRAVDGVLAFELDIEGLACIDACFRASLDVGVVEGNRARSGIISRFLEDNGPVAKHIMLIGIAYPCASHVVVVVPQLADDDFLSPNGCSICVHQSSIIGIEICSCRCYNDVVVLENEVN